MAEIIVTAEGTIGAPAEDVYRYISDYRQHHPRFLPPAIFDLEVERGGVGDGTLIRFKVKALGSTRSYYQRITEPEPGRVLAESGIDTGEVTTFTVTPAGPSCRLRIETRTPASRGLRGLVERLAAPRLLRGLYYDELVRLDRYARERVSAPAATSAG